MSRNNKAFSVVAGFTCLFLSLASNAGKPGDGASSPQDVNVVNTPTVNVGSGGPIGVDVLSLPSQPLIVTTESLKSVAETQTFQVLSDRVAFTPYTPSEGKRVVIKSLLLSATRDISSVSLHFNGGWQRVPTDSRNPVTASWPETTIALPEGPFWVEVALTYQYSVEVPANLLVTFYEVPAN